MTNYCKCCLYPKKKPRTQPKFHWTTPSLHPPHLRDPHLLAHFFWVVCAVCTAPDSAACCCFSCCLCSCCGLLLPLFLLLLVFVAAFGQPTIEPPPLPPLQCLTFQNVNNVFLQLIGSFSPQPIETKFAGIPPNFHGKTLFPLPHHPSEAHTSWP